MEKSNGQSSTDGETAEKYHNVEYLEVESASNLQLMAHPSFEDSSERASSEIDAENPLFLHSPEAPHRDGSESDFSAQSLLRTDVPAEVNVTVNLSAKEFKQYAFHFIGVFYVRLFKTQRLAEPVQTCDIFGNTIDELLMCLWRNSCPYISGEVVVNNTSEAKTVFWSTRDIPEFTDINTIWELVNKNLLQTGNKDRAGASTTEELFECVSELKEVHCHYTALNSSWVKWANFILSQPGDRRSSLMHEAPPDEYLHLFRAPSISEGSQLQVTRRGMHIAVNICDSVTGKVNQLCEVVDNLAKELSKVQMMAHELKSEIETSRSLLDSMQNSMPPEESEFSKKLASAVGEMIDIDHQE